MLQFCTPMALPLGEGIAARAVVYDCMDDLASFKFAPPALVQREAELMARADVVFTSGPSMYRARKDRHPNIHCFSSSVDAAHFGQARSALEEPADQAARPRPRLGYFGVIDERFDVALLDALARARPDWQFVMVGPVCKIDPPALPRHDNILYTGPQSHADLPRYLAGWDVRMRTSPRGSRQRITRRPPQWRRCDRRGHGSRPGTERNRPRSDRARSIGTAVA